MLFEEPISAAPLSSSSLCAVPNIRMKRLNPSLSIIISREVLEKLKENT